LLHSSHLCVLDTTYSYCSSRLFKVGLVAAASVYQTVRRKSVWEELGLFSIQGVAGGEDAIGCCLDAGDGAFLRPGGGAPWPQVRLAVRRRVDYLAARAANEKEASQEALVAAVMAAVHSSAYEGSGTRDASESTNNSSDELSSDKEVLLNEEKAAGGHLQDETSSNASTLSPVSEAAAAVIVAKEAHLAALSDALAVRCVGGADHRVAYVRALGNAADVVKETAASLAHAQAIYADATAKVAASTQAEKEEAEEANNMAREAAQKRLNQKSSLQVCCVHPQVIYVGV